MGLRSNEEGMHRPGDAFTGLELVIVLVVIAGSGMVFLGALDAGNSGGVRSFPGGLIADSAYISGDHIQPVGSVMGLSRVPRTMEKTELVFSDPAPDQLGAVDLTVSLFLGDTGAIDMDRVTVLWTGSEGSDVIAKTGSRTLVCPNWTIAGRNNLLPGRTADADDWLEPTEQFVLLICPARGIPANTPFVVTMSPEGTALPLRISRTTPSRIQPVMNLR